ncbi:hypothetical protein [Ferrimonas balearica]|uniref:hypothetical protein n=1 Tax=Ferrimonas balearica TaxID=44012 RepID=UPI0011D0456E|nr:hypothetical protein [Ferrimonas balearica]
MSTRFFGLKTLFFLIFFFSSFLASANERHYRYFEIGFGVEYGGIGSKVFFPYGNEYFDIFISLGAIVSDGDELNMASGIGIEFPIGGVSSINIYSGVSDVTSTYNQFLAKWESEKIYGISVSYQLSIVSSENYSIEVGPSYTITSQDSYPFLSLGLRF